MIINRPTTRTKTIKMLSTPKGLGGKRWSVVRKVHFGCFIFIFVFFSFLFLSLSHFMLRNIYNL